MTRLRLSVLQRWTTTMNSRYLLPLLTTLLTCLLPCLFPASSWGLSCYAGDYGGVTRHITILDHQITVPANAKQGTILWRSPTYSVNVTCYDTNNSPFGEDAYLYWNPGDQLGTINNSIAVGVNYQSIDIIPKNMTRTDLGYATLPPASVNACRGPGSAPGQWWNIFAPRCAQPQTLTITYSIFIEATGNAPSATSQVNNTGTYSLFRVDGNSGLHTTSDSNYTAYISGLNNVRFVSCNPQISIEGNDGNTVDFGMITADRNTQAGTIAKERPFSVVASLDSPESGQACRGETLQATFSTNNPVQDEDTILPESNSGFGIQIFPANNNSAVKMNNPVALGIVNGTQVKNTFTAGLKWLSNSPKAGPFNATATIDVTYR
ncbi:fimbrial protein [Cernens ardua]|uniref:fimbrial protein n=1 Tax=Cernens ardua TaxID=3402176 RepID=UPI003F9E7414